MKTLTLAEYNAIPKSSRDVWTVEREDLKDWAKVRTKYMGKRTMLDYDPQRGTVLLIEDMHFRIVKG